MTSDDGGTFRSLLLDAVADSRTELRRVVRRVVDCETPNPPGDTSELVDLISNYLAECPCNVQRYEPKPGAANLVVTVGGEEPGRSLLVLSHLDTFPPNASETRAADVTSDDCIPGLGVTDMKAGVAIAVVLARLVAELGLPRGTLTFVFAADEESGGQWGAQWLLEEVPTVVADACICGDQTGPDIVAVGEKGFCWLTLVASGRAGHSAYGSSENAINRLVHALSRLLQIDGKKSPSLHALSHTRTSGLEDRVTVNIGRIDGGKARNLTAERATAEVDIRIPHGIGVDEIVEEITTLLEDLGDSVRWELQASFPPTMTEIGTDIVQVLLANCQIEGGAHRDAVPMMRIGASDTRFVRARGIPAVVHGFKPRGMGGADEYVLASELDALARIHAGTIADFLSRAVAAHG